MHTHTHLGIERKALCVIGKHSTTESTTLLLIELLFILIK